MFNRRVTRRAYFSGMARIGNLLHTHWRRALAALAISPVGIAALCFAGLPQPALMVVCAAVIAANFAFSRAIVSNTSSRLEEADALHQSAQGLLAIAHTDPVTGQFNRSGGDARLSALAEGLNEGEVLALMWIDLLRFRETNNTLGHARGDNLLHQVGQRLQDAAPEGALIARFSGDRFLLAARNMTPESAQQLAERVHETMTSPLHIAGHRIANGAAIGVAMMPGDARCIEQLQEAADLALYHARTAEHAEMRFHDPSMIRAFDQQKRTEAELRDAILKNELPLVSQPIVDLQTGRTRAFEAQGR